MRVLIIGINGYNLSGYKQIFITVSSIILPMIANEFLYTYMTKNISFWPTLIYKILIECINPEELFFGKSI